MGVMESRLSDRFDLTCSNVLLNGTQALVRLMLEQAARDAAAGLNTAGYVTGYRGSPLGAVDFQMKIAGSLLDEAGILFSPALNEDLAATALWGAQQAELRGEGLYDGVFGLWYGKGPGVDRSGDVLRHANLAGTSPRGGIVMALGDDHTGESSTTLHQSEFALMDAYIPVLSPAGVQEIIDFGLLGYGLSRFSGNWVGLKCMKETVESTAVISVVPDRLTLQTPDFDLPDGGLNIRLVDTPRDQEARIIDYRRYAAEAFWRANRMDRRVLGRPGARTGFISSGKSWLDLMHAFELLGIDDSEAEALGLTVYKVGMSWPLDRCSFLEWIDGLDLVVVVEEKRKLIEFQVKEAVSGNSRGTRVYGRHDGQGAEIFPSKYALEPVWIAEKVGKILEDEGRVSDRLAAKLASLRALPGNAGGGDLAVRTPYFCSGCPHNISTKVPAGSRAYAGIGCHYMVQWMDRETVGFTHMGGEGANWIGEAPFSSREHVFQNIGDGTYNHSGIMAIRAAVAAGVNVTFKILFNDAVAMTGGQGNDGDLTAARVAHELTAMGLKRVVLVYDDKEDVEFSEFPAGIGFRVRDELEAVQMQLRNVRGVTAIIYLQTCAAEKRRRRKRGTFPVIDRRVFINTDVCEGCGDCGTQSNCVSIIPVDTEFGTKRAIDQSNCNQDFSCLKGFCPSFVTVNGARPRRKEIVELNVPDLPMPRLPEISGTYNVLVTGVGGTGVVSVGAILTMAAFLDDKGAAMIEMAGLAQKGGAVCIHCRIAERPENISAIRVSIGELDCLIGGDLVVSAGHDILSTARKGRTRASINEHEIITGEFTRKPESRIPTEDLKVQIALACGNDRSWFLDASELAGEVFGDTIFSNMIVVGHAWQSGFLPLSINSIERAIELNGAAVEDNLKAFALGRWAACQGGDVERLVGTSGQESGSTRADRTGAYEQHLFDHTGEQLVGRWRDLVHRCTDPGLRAAVAEGYHKLLTAKDEYEVARLHLATESRLRAEFEGKIRMTFHLAPPVLNSIGTDGRPRKREFGPWVLTAFRLLARMKWMRNTPLDPFRHGRDRRLQRTFLNTYEKDMAEILDNLNQDNMDAAIELARLPLEVKGFGPVWERNYEGAMRRRDELFAKFRSAGVDDIRISAE